MYWFNLSPKMVVFCELGRQGTEAQGYLQLQRLKNSQFEAAASSHEIK